MTYFKKIEHSRLQFQQTLGCAICIDFPVTPMRTQCQHCFCKECLDSLFRNSSNPVPCPICKTPINKRSLEKCPQLENIIKTIKKLYTTLENDLKSISAPCNVGLSETKLKVKDCNRKLEAKNVKKTDDHIDDSDRKPPEGKSAKNRKLTSKLNKASEKEVNVGITEKENRNQTRRGSKLCKDGGDILKDDSVLDWCEEKTKERKPRQNKRSVEVVLEEKDDPCDDDKRENVQLTETSSTFMNKVTTWLNDYCINPSAGAEADDNKGECQPKCEIQELKKQASESDGDCDNVVERKPNSKRANKFFKCRNEDDSSEMKPVKVEDPYEYVSSQQQKSTQQKRNQTGRRKNKNKPLKASTPYKKSLPAVTLKNEWPAQGKEDAKSDDQVDPYELFNTPTRGVTNAAKSVKKPTKKKTRKKVKNEPDVGDELESLAKDMELIEMHELEIEKTAPIATKESKNKRKLKSSTHSFTESQYEIQHQANSSSVRDRSAIEKSNGLAIKKNYVPSDKSLENMKLKSLKVVLDVVENVTKKNETLQVISEVVENEFDLKDDSSFIFNSHGDDQKYEKGDEDVEMINIGTDDEEAVGQDQNSVVNLTEPKRRIIYFKYGKLRLPPTEVSVGCQTDVLNEEAAVANADEAFQRLLEKKSAIDDDDYDSVVEVLQRKCSDENPDSNCFESPRRISLVPPSELQHLHSYMMNNDSETNSTPSKPPKRMKTIRGLARISSFDSEEITNLPPPSQTFSSAKRSVSLHDRFSEEVKNLSKRSSASAKRSFSFSKPHISSDSEESEPMSVEKRSDEKVKKYRSLKIIDDSNSEEELFSQSAKVDSKTKPSDDTDTSQRKNALEKCFKALETPSSSTPKLTYDSFKAEMLNGHPEKAKLATDVDDSLSLLSGSEELEESMLDENIGGDEEKVAPAQVYVSTPINKDDVNTELQLDNSQTSDDDTLPDISLASSNEDITTQKYLKLKEYVKNLQREKKIMENELLVAEVTMDATTTSGKCSTAVKPKVFGDQLMTESSDRVSSFKTTVGTGISSKQTSRRNLGEPNCLTERDVLEMDTLIVSPTPEQKPKWACNKLKKSETSDKLSAAAKFGMLDKSVGDIVPTRDRPPQRKPYAFTTTGVCASQNKQVKQLAQVLNGSFSSTFIRNVTTHIVVIVGTNRLCERTLKYLYGIGCGCWIVSFDWVVDSLSANRALPEEDYESKGDNNGGAHGGPTKARLNPTPLLKDFQVLILDSFRDLTRDQICALLECCGSTVISLPLRHHRSPPKQLIIVDKPLNDKLVQQCHELYLTHGLTTIYRDWLLDSIASFTVKPLNNYAVPLDVSTTSRRIH